jgi:hypothetical protein
MLNTDHRPISNLCSTSKIFEKLILKGPVDLQDSNQVDFTGNQQHGFKKVELPMVYFYNLS